MGWSVDFIIVALWGKVSTTTSGVSSISSCLYDVCFLCSLSNLGLPCPSPRASVYQLQASSMKSSAAVIRHISNFPYTYQVRLRTYPSCLRHRKYLPCKQRRRQKMVHISMHRLHWDRSQRSQQLRSSNPTAILSASPSFNKSKGTYRTLSNSPYTRSHTMSSK